MTPLQIQRTQAKITAIRKALADEKRRFGAYDDSRGMRYLPPELYVKIRDFKGAQVYYRWFDKNFPNDSGFPLFLFYWSLTLFKNNKRKEAEQKALKTFCANTYLIDQYLGLPWHPFDVIPNAEWHKAQALDVFPTAAKGTEFPDFSDWLLAFVQSERYQAITKEYLDLAVQLLTTPVGELRTKMVTRMWSLCDE
ncbi:MAG: hypothetical protein KGS48_03935 [Bacteroidetes bacterium]|nr:hypothetical protein [Bacteroidota bacterium]